MKLKYIIALIVAGTAMIVVPVFFHRRFPRVVKEFFTQPGSAVNLAVFRIVLFALLLWRFPMDDSVYFAGLPKELLAPPTGVGWLVPFLPIDPVTASIIYGAFALAALGALVGWHTQWMACLTVVFGLYVLGVPQLYGKINHYHHLLWFSAILAASPCGDALSVDALRTAWRRRRLPARPIAPHALAYSLPLRFIWLLMGMIYFWAGTWKWWTEGWTWAFSDNLKFALYEKWLQVGGWTPIIRVDRYDAVLHWLAAYTIVFEITFVFLILFPLLRPLAVALGLGFHIGTGVFMQISFITLQICYTAFVNWQSVFQRLGKRLFPQVATLGYDGDCSFCQRSVAVLQQLDVFGRIEYRNLRTSTMDAVTDIVLERSADRWAGFEAYRHLSLRIPGLWPFVPFLSMPPVAWVGRRVYRRVADHRACSLTTPVPELPAPERSWRAAATVGSFLVYVLVLSSIAKYHSWPFAGYPTFEDLLTKPEVSVLFLEAERPDGTKVSSDALLDRLLPRMSPERYHSVLIKVFTAEDPDDQRRRLAALWCRALEERPDLATLDNIRFHRALVSTRPDNWGQPPLSKQHLTDVPKVLCAGPPR
jgi:predicted DCC family thiol-disulfide oxidoreductase YuxK/uncharacterized membrane protein